MSKEDTAPGLLSKMVKFVRNPATNWGDLDSAQTDREEAMSKQLLKEMIERKRRNDFVRKREFDMLRKLRKREAMVGVGQDPAGRPSFFQSSMPSRPDDRATTLKKIDEIEAQMSMQWWKTKSSNSPDTTTQGPMTVNSKAPPSSTVDPLHDVDPALVTAYRVTTNSPRLDTASGPTLQAPLEGREIPTEIAPLPMPPRTPAAGRASSSVAAGLARSGAGRDAGLSEFSASKTLAMDVLEVVAHDAELEEAAIRFANGDDAGAEAGLLEILEPGASRAGHLDTWLTLFDLYRATAQQDKFELAALQFVGHFDRSAPQWFSMPDMVKTLAGPRESAGAGPTVDWICPSIFGIQTLAALKAAVSRAAPPWCLDWSNLKSIDALAADPLCRLFGDWAAQPVKLSFMGEAQLLTVLQNATPSGGRDVAQAWWLLRMAAMRVTRRADDFELTALDFCVTYEVSPPAWESARCDYEALDAQGAVAGAKAIIGHVFRDSIQSGLNAEWDTQMDGPNSELSSLMSVELSGQIQGDAIAVLDQLEIKLMGADMMVISCAKLIRVDFSAAGTLLNWVSARESEHRTVQFIDVNRLVAAFFNVIGITEHARVMVRFD